MSNLGSSNLLNKILRVSWHAGEPTVLPTSFYREAFAEFEKHNKYGVKIEHNFQTNATLINKEYCELIKDFNIAIGVSIDGPEHIHDKNRVLRNGKGSFLKTMQGINFLQQNNIEYSVITVLTEFSLDYPNEMYDFFKSLNVKSVGFNVEEKEGCHQTTTMNETTVSKYRKFLLQFISKIKEGDFKLYQREYNRIVNSIIYRSEDFKNGLITPLSTITVDYEGNFTAFSPELLTVTNNKHDNYIFGNVQTTLFSEIFVNQNFKNIYSEILEGVAMCKLECDYFNVCGGGSPSSKLHENGTFASTETNYCIYNIKVPTDIVLDELTPLIK